MEDLDALYEAVRESVKEVSPWLPWCHAGYTPEETAAFLRSSTAGWDSGEHYGFGIFDSEARTLLGGVGLNQLNGLHRYANLGYWVRSSRTGRGVASSAVRLAARFGLEDVCLQRIEIVIAVANSASQRAAEKAGATREGVLRKRLLTSAGPLDAVMYSLVTEDFN
jgi:RimJ/RimL family protein N-acetyltransferase